MQSHFDTVPPSSSFETADLQSQTRSTSKCLVLSLPVPFLRSTISPWSQGFLLRKHQGAATKPFRNKDGQAIRTLAKSKQGTTHHFFHRIHNPEMPRFCWKQWFPEHPKRVRNFFLQGTKNVVQEALSTSQKHKASRCCTLIQSMLFVFFRYALNLKPPTSTTNSPLLDYIYYTR